MAMNWARLPKAANNLAAEDTWPWTGQDCWTLALLTFPAIAGTRASPPRQGAAPVERKKRRAYLGRRTPAPEDHEEDPASKSPKRKDRPQTGQAH